MHPLQVILSWWELLEEFPRDWIAAEVYHRLMSRHDGAGRHDILLREYLTEDLVANRHVGRAIAVRAIIDFYFVRAVSQDSMQFHLDAVEGDDADLKQLSNGAIGRHLLNAPGQHRARDTWRALCETAVSDEALLSWERACIVRSILS